MLGFLYIKHLSVMKKSKSSNSYLYLGVIIIIIGLALGLAYFRGRPEVVVTPLTSEEIENQNMEAERINKMIYDTEVQIQRLKNNDLKKTGGRNRRLFEKQLAELQLVIDNYERLLDLRYNGVEINTQEGMFAGLLMAAKTDDVSLIDTKLTDLLKILSTEKNLLFVSAVMAAGPSIPANVTSVNAAPGSGYRRQKVTVGGRSYLVDVVAADLNNTKVIVDTASDGTCGNNCPVLPLATYVSRSGAYAGINGTYFCPDTYPSCVDKKNTFDVLVMNKNKTYFNSDNNVYSTVPAAIFSPGSSRFVSASRDWGRDTGVDAVIANRPLLTLDGNVMFGGGEEVKESARGNRSFLGASGSTAYMGVIRGASVAEAATVLQAMGVRSAINLDSGGSTALWSGGYKAGPGRRIPNAVLFVRR